jgi:hypothetical protein
VHHLASRGAVAPDAKNRYVALLQANRPKVAGGRL